MEQLKEKRVENVKNIGNKNNMEKLKTENHQAL